MIVGEAPGEQEDIQGVPFVGQSGKLLDAMLADAGWQRKDCYVTNVVNVRPKDNDFNHLYKDGVKRKEPTDELIASYERLRQEVAGSGCNVVVAAGAEALRALTCEAGIGKLRGSVLPSTLCPGKKVVGIYHPAAIMRQFGWRPIAVMDLARAVREAGYPDIRTIQRDLQVSLDFAGLVSELERIRTSHESTKISFDIETAQKQVQCIAFATERYRAVVVPFFWKGASVWSMDEELQLWTLVRQILEGPHRKIAQNADYDVMFLRKTIGINVANVWLDTMLAHHCVYPEFPKGLDFLCSMYTDHPYYKDGIDATDRHAFWRYNALDACITYEVSCELEKELKEFKVEQVYFGFIQKMAGPLQDMGDRGILVDEDRRKVIANELSTQMQEDQRKLNELAGYELNVNSPKQMVKFLYTDLPNMLQTKSRKKKGTREYVETPTTDAAAIDKLNRKKPHACYDLILSIREKQKLLSTYIDLSIDVDGRVRTGYKIAGTKSGRLSSSETIFGIGLNIQNVPSGPAREIYIPDAGNVFIQGDLSQAEARIVAYVAGEERLIEVFEQGGDIHKRNAAIIFGKTVEEVLPQERQLAKKIVHASNYGMGARRFKEVCWEELNLEIDEATAKKYQRMYFNQFPKIELWHRNIQAQLYKNRTLTTPYGRKRTFWGFLSDEMFKEAYSYVPQSTVSDHLNHSLLDLDEYLKSSGTGVLVMQVHDSLMVQCPIGKEEMMMERMRYFMDRPLVVGGRSCRIPVDFKVGPNWNALKEVK
jgi:DNA polymerase-1